MLERTLGAKGLPLVKMNPQRTRAFAKAAGRLSKTDRIDAAMLAHFGALMRRRSGRSAAMPLMRFANWSLPDER